MVLKKLILSVAVSGLMVGGTAVSASANSTFSGTYKVWSADTNNNDDTSGATIQQALPGAVSHFVNGADGGGGGSVHNVFTATTGTFTSSQLNFTDPSGGTDTILGFLNTDVGGFTHTGCTGTGPGTCAGETLSSSSYRHVSLFEFIFTVGSNGTLSVTHDDGASLFVDGNTTTDLFPVGDSAPTTAEDSLAILTAGTYDLWYTEANGLPAELVVDFTPTAVPEPVSMALLGSGLVAFGFMRRRRQPSANAI